MALVIEHLNENSKKVDARLKICPDEESVAKRFI